MLLVSKSSVTPILRTNIELVIERERGKGSLERLLLHMIHSVMFPQHHVRGYLIAMQGPVANHISPTYFTTSPRVKLAEHKQEITMQSCISKLVLSDITVMREKERV